MGGVTRTARETTHLVESVRGVRHDPGLRIEVVGSAHGSPVGLTATQSATGTGGLPHDSGR